MSAAAARTRARAHAPSRTPAPRPRRVSGPVARPAARPAPRRDTGAFARIRALPEHRVLDRLLRGRAWIWLIGGALMGIVAMQVSLLKLNTGISRAVQTATTLERSNAQLEGQIARLASNERISRIALERGMIAPSAGSVVYVHARPEVDADKAVRRMGPPSEEARALAAAPTTTTPDAIAPIVTTAAPAVSTAPASVAAAPTPGQG
jgi:cell division protein FtsL